MRITFPASGSSEIYTWEENGFISALLELGMRREDSFQFSGHRVYSGAERLYASPALPFQNMRLAH